MVLRLGKWHPIKAAAAAYSACQCILLFDNIKNSFALATSQLVGGKKRFGS